MNAELNAIIEYVQQVETVPYTQRKESSDSELIEFNTSKMNHVMGAALYNFAKTLTADLLDKASGFKQVDGTYALFNYKHELLKDLMTTDWDHLRPEMKHYYTEQGKKATAIFVTAMLEI